MIPKKSKRIITDEKSEVEIILSQPTPKYISFRIMFLLAKYYYSLGLTHKETRRKIVEYCKNSSDFNFTLREASINNALKKAKFNLLKKNDYLIPITKKEIDKIKKLSHFDYRIMLYIIFYTKLDRFQNLDTKRKKAKTLSPYFNHDIRTVYYNIVNQDKKSSNNLSTKKELETVRRLELAGVISVQNNRNLIVTCIDLDNGKNIEFLINASENFYSQIIYYCVQCGKKTEKSKNHDFCKECYKIKRREYKTEKDRKYRADKQTRSI